MTVSDRLARFNRWVPNRVIGKIAGRRLSPVAYMLHQGRKSGRQFRTPVMPLSLADGFLVSLPYGAERDWVRNVVAAGHCTLLRGGRRFELTDPASGSCACPTRCDTGTIALSDPNREEQAMLADSKAFSGFAVPDLARAREFYADTLGLRVSGDEQDGALTLHLAGGRDVLVYIKPDHAPASYTILNFLWRTSRGRSTPSPPGACASSSTTASSRTTRGSTAVRGR